MPLVDLTLPEGTLSAENKRQLLAELMRILLKWEGAPETPQTQSLAWAYVQETKAGEMMVGGAVPDLPHYRIIMTVPQGALNDKRKEELVAEVTRAILEVEGAEWNEQNCLRVWCIVQEVPDGNLGGGGRIFRLRDLVKFVRNL